MIQRRCYTVWKRWKNNEWRVGKRLKGGRCALFEGIQGDSCGTCDGQSVTATRFSPSYSALPGPIIIRRYTLM
jgi:hypothetical protein